ncbi:MAG TPA: nuclear transport factor 2 family protein [Burkholderiales bacterium]|nr:nuclear transport factor 2 family protein [Burkholderiales bacterium]
MTDFLAADYAIRQLHGRYVDAAWRKDADALANCFAEGAEWKIAGMHLRGRAEIADAFTQLTAGSERVLMIVGMPILEIGQGTASGRVHVTEIIKRLDGTAARTIGVYYDRYVGEGDNWMFQSRHWQVFYRGPTDFSAPFIDGPEHGLPPGMPGPDDPTTPRKNF